MGDETPRRRRRSTLLRRLLGLLTWAVVVVGVWTVLPTQWGGHLGVTVVAGHSMEPTYHTGDLLLTWRSSEYEPGDVIVYRVPAGQLGSGHPVVHRIRAVAADGSFTVRGDNNPTQDLWHPTADDTAGRVLLAAPGAGRWLRLLVSPLALALLCGCLVAWTVAAPSRRGAPRASSEGDGPEGPDDADDNRPGGPPRGDVGAAPPRRHAVRTSAPVHRATRSSSRAPARLVLALGAALVVVLGGASAATMGGVQARSLAAYTYPASVPVGDSVTFAQTLTSDNPLNYCAEVTVTNRGKGPVDWRITLDLRELPFNAASITQSYNVTSVSFKPTESWTVEGVSHNKTLAAGASATWGYCANRSESSIPLSDATTKVTVSSESGGQYCTNVTVTTTSSSWIRWVSTIDPSTPGVTAARYRLDVEPSNRWQVATQSFSAAQHRWRTVGAPGTDQRFIKAGTSATWGYCAPTR